MVNGKWHMANGKWVMGRGYGPCQWAMDRIPQLPLPISHGVSMAHFPSHISPRSFLADFLFGNGQRRQRADSGKNQVLAASINP
jgi:hypothetical protein